ncbi:CDP-glycerol glycerophosphotransferase family protein [Shewanella sp. GutDb-MelDb]|uniref:CDP-glycerol glycerophosphotransferase family protein n=1 Tax=Shewanella sp. GutDb-MelDb TaxID=2058316 RepID=UPI000C7A3844|nr:CDP-glycerol glycerophosphotransferase family protein [Shewanella sp. GutDb-MelDb]PKG56619.1 CDP-glycerol--glycerophosphate glycerophosphotransferase [Shewanella sp. GutDb-MelDb]
MQNSALQWAKAATRKLVYWLSALAPRNANKAVFGSYKELFSDNSKYLYKHWQQSQFIRCIWITANKDIIKQLQGDGCEAYYRWSIQGAYHALTAKYYFYNSYIGDINQWLAKGAVKVNLWHGLPMKKIEFDITSGPMAKVFNPTSRFQTFIQSMHAHQQRIKPDLMLSPSPLVDELFNSAFRLKSSNLLRCGYPRTDYYRLTPHQAQSIKTGVLLKNAKCSERGAEIESKTESKIQSEVESKSISQSYQQVILYAPSWRDAFESKRFEDETPYTAAFNWQALSEHLQKNNQLFLLRLHPNEAELGNNLASLPNILNISAMEDVYGILHEVDMLITDYSSLFIDVLPLNIPICFYRFDKAQYQQNCREMYEYSNSMPTLGPECLTFNELLLQIEPASVNALTNKYGANYQTANKMLWGDETESFSALEEWVQAKTV